MRNKKENPVFLIPCQQPFTKVAKNIQNPIIERKPRKETKKTRKEDFLDMSLSLLSISVPKNI